MREPVQAKFPGESSGERGLGMRLSIIPKPQLIDTVRQLSYVRQEKQASIGSRS